MSTVFGGSTFRREESEGRVRVAGARSDMDLGDFPHIGACSEKTKRATFCGRRTDPRFNLGHLQPCGAGDGYGGKKGRAQGEKGGELRKKKFGWGSALAGKGRGESRSVGRDGQRLSLSNEEEGKDGKPGKSDDASTGFFSLGRGPSFSQDRTRLEFQLEGKRVLGCVSVNGRICSCKV